MKKLNVILILICFAVFVNSGCIKVENDQFDLSKYDATKFDTIRFGHSMKGWELYSWPVSTKWRYSLLIGTNAAKTYSQVTTNPLCITGEDSLKVLLSKLPHDEELMWIGKNWLESCWVSGNRGNLSLPPKAIQIEIKEFCDNHNLRLTIVE